MKFDSVDTNLIVDNDNNDVESAMIKEELDRAIQIGFERLTPRQVKVLRMRFGIGDDCDYTLAEVGKKMGVSPERIRQIESKALRLLRHPSRTEALKTFIEEGEVLC